MKKLFSVIIILCVVSSAFATRIYHPHKKKIEVTFTDGDRVIFSTKYTTVTVTNLEIISRNNITYTVPEDALLEIKRPQIDTVHLTFQRMGEKYQEGTFYLYFDYVTDDKSKEKELSRAEFVFENGIYVGTFEDWYENKKKHNKSSEPILKTPGD